MKPPSLNGGAVLGLIVLAGCTGNLGLQLGESDHEPIDWAQQNREEIENAKPEPEPDIEPVTHFAAGQLFEGKGSIPLAVLQYRKAIELKPDFVSAYNRLGVCLNKLGRFKEAEDCFSEAVSRSPGRAYLRNNLGFSLMLQKRWEEAAVHLQQAVSSHPEFKRARINLGMALAHQGREGDAMAHFERAVGTARAYYNLGLVYKMDGRVHDAQRAFERALQMQPDLPMVQDHLDELQARAATMPPAPNPPQEGIDTLSSKPRLAAAAVPDAEAESENQGVTSQVAPQQTLGPDPSRLFSAKSAAPLAVPIEQYAGCEDPLARLEFMQVAPPCATSRTVEQFGWDKPACEEELNGGLGADLQTALDNTLESWKASGPNLDRPTDVPELLRQLRRKLTEAWQQQQRLSAPQPVDPAYEPSAQP